MSLVRPGAVRSRLPASGRLVSRRGVMEAYDFPSLDAVRMFARRRGIPHVMVGKRALYDSADWERLMAPPVRLPGPIPNTRAS